jgi:hypothetical protein
MKAARGLQSQSCRIDNQITGRLPIQLKAKGVKPLHEVTKATWGAWFDLNDPDGNHWLVVQS